jgi:predicted lipoprotein with Yx(FWY)xxD motif
LKRIYLIAAALAIFALPAVGSAKGKHKPPPTVRLGNTGKGKLLENSRGVVILIFSGDSKNKDTCQFKVGCPQSWPAVSVKGKPTGGPGVNSKLLGTITLANGTTQVTYNGHPLYTFGGERPGDTGPIGALQQGGVWYGINAAGNRVS